mgnify:CR=1 FL=1
MFLCTYVVIICNKNMLKRNIFVIYPHTKLSNTYICCRWWGRLLLLPLLIKNIHQTSLLLLQNSYYCCDCYYTADTAIVTTATATSNSWDFVIWYYRAAKRWWDEYGCVLPLSYNCMRGGGGRGCAPPSKHWKKDPQKASPAISDIYIYLYFQASSSHMLYCLRVVLFLNILFVSKILAFHIWSLLRRSIICCTSALIYSPVNPCILKHLYNRHVFALLSFYIYYNNQQ